VGLGGDVWRDLEISVDMREAKSMAGGNGLSWLWRKYFVDRY
jgi:hypothetical protein